MAVTRVEDDGKGLFGQQVFRTIETSDDGLVELKRGKKVQLTLKVGDMELVLEGDAAKRHAADLSDLGIL